MISALLLAAGESRRMGDFKQLLKLGEGRLFVGKRHHPGVRRRSEYRNSVAKPRFGITRARTTADIRRARA